MTEVYLWWRLLALSSWMRIGSGSDKEWGRSVLFGVGVWKDKWMNEWIGVGAVVSRGLLDRRRDRNLLLYAALALSASYERACISTEDEPGELMIGWGNLIIAGRQRLTSFCFPSASREFIRGIYPSVEVSSVEKVPEISNKTRFIFYSRTF